jgi:hypothetical protein
MKALTHLSAGGAAGAGLALLVGLPLGWERALLAGALGAAVPEVEYGFFRLAKELRAHGYRGAWLSAASWLGQERGPCHGLEVLLLGGGLVGLAGWAMGRQDFSTAYTAFLGGWFSHLLLDLLNGGIRPLALLLPFQWARFPPWGIRRVVRGGPFEAFVLLATGWVWVWRLVEKIFPYAESLLERWL